jgi:hypothetical protein
MSPQPTQKLLKRRLPGLLAVLGIVLSLAAIGIVTTQVRTTLSLMLEQSAQASAQTLTRVFVSESWDGIKELTPPPNSSGEVIRGNPNLPAIDVIARRFAGSADVLRIKIFNLQGLIVYSSNPSDIGRSHGLATLSRLMDRVATATWSPSICLCAHPGVSRRLSSCISTVPIRLHDWTTRSTP